MNRKSWVLSIAERLSVNEATIGDSEVHCWPAFEEYVNTEGAN